MTESGGGGWGDASYDPNVGEFQEYKSESWTVEGPQSMSILEGVAPQPQLRA